MDGMSVIFNVFIVVCVGEGVQNYWYCRIIVLCECVASSPINMTALTVAKVTAVDCEQGVIVLSPLPVRPDFYSIQR